MYLVLNFQEAEIRVQILYWRRALRKNLEGKRKQNSTEEEAKPECLASASSHGKIWSNTEWALPLHQGASPLYTTEPALGRKPLLGVINNLLSRGAPLGWGHFTGEGSSCARRNQHSQQLWGKVPAWKGDLGGTPTISSAVYTLHGREPFAFLY